MGDRRRRNVDGDVALRHAVYTRVQTLEFLRGQVKHYLKAEKTREAAMEQACTDLCQALLSANEFVYLD